MDFPRWPYHTEKEIKEYQIFSEQEKLIIGQVKKETFLRRNMLLFVTPSMQPQF